MTLLQPSKLGFIIAVKTSKLFLSFWALILNFYDLRSCRGKDMESDMYLVNFSGANLMMMWCHDAQNRRQLITIMVAMMTT